MIDDENLDTKESKPQTEAIGGDSLPPRKTALDYNNDDNWWKSREQALIHLAKQSLKGTPLSDKELTAIRHFEITVDDIEIEVKRQLPKT